MSLSAGSRLGPYEITVPLGAGGMGEVYKARDTRLDRTVAIKVLPADVAADPDFRQRFEREARTVAALNHPHICTLHDIGQQDGIDFLVMEYLEGETLAERLKKGPLLIDQAFRYAVEIADALDKAHRQGIVHRDLKPGNIMLTKSGTKLLDFGLARIRAGGTSMAGGLAWSAVPTEQGLTAQGTILGTLQYMAPEQLEGKEADARTDIFAFGAVVYEMTTGKKAFEGKSQASLIAAILDSEPPPIPNLQPLAPPLLDHVVKRCLAKDPDERWQAASDVMRELKWIAEAGWQTSVPAFVATTAPRSAAWRRVAALAVGLVAGSILTGTAVWIAMRAAPPRVARLTMTPSSTAALAVSGIDRDLAISPDGARLVYVGSNGAQLFVRALDQLEATPLAGLGTLRHPFISPDGAWIGFFDGRGLKKVPIGGGPAVTLFRITSGLPRGATWGPDDTIIFASGDRSSGLWRVSAAGGEPTVLTTPNRERGEGDHWWPEFLPGGQAVLFTIVPDGSIENAQVAVLDLRTSTQKVLVRGGSHAHYVPSGHLVYGVGGTLRAAAFDLDRLEVVGIPSPVLQQIVTTPFGAGDFDVARNGTLVYVLGGGAALARTLVWVDRQGHEEPIKAPVRAYTYPRLSPDGTRVALEVRDQESDIWIWDFGRETLTRFTFDPASDWYPVWTPDGGRVVFSSARTGPMNLFWQAADGTASVERLTQSPNTQHPYAVSPDGTRLVFREDAPTLDLMVLTLAGERRAQPLVQTIFNEVNAEISPDGRWVAYQSNESGEFEIYVRRFPNVAAGRWQISTGGGTRPLWARNGRELFYLAPTGALMSVWIERGATWTAGTPTKLFEGRSYFGGTGGRAYDVSRDGQRFLMVKPGGGPDQTATPASLIVVLNWFEELKRLVPTR